MNNSANSAIELLASHGWREPGDMSMEEIAWASGLIVKYHELEGSQGRILMNSNDAIITINKAITYQPKVNFIIAHEIGHARLHRNLSLFSDNEQTLQEWYARGVHEKEANDFATELLMPRDLFKMKVCKKKLELPLIETVAEYFGASKTATFLRYRELGDYPVMIIFIENGMIKWKSSSPDFPYKWLTLGSNVPSYTVAGDFFYKNIKEKKPEKVNAIEWFPDDSQCQREKNAKLWEQCFPSATNTIVTCLWAA